MLSVASRLALLASTLLSLSSCVEPVLPATHKSVPQAGASATQVPETAQDRRSACALEPKARAARFLEFEEREVRTRGGSQTESPATALAHRLAAARAVVETCACQEAIDLTRQLVAFQTVAALPPKEQTEQFSNLLSLLSVWSRNAGLALSVSGENDAWEITLPGSSSGRSLLLVTHADVVPINDPPAVIALDAIPSGWTVPPFDAKIVQGRLYGRGTEDDKGPIAAALIALRELRALGIVPSKELTLALGTGEEHDWEGMKRYAAKAPPAEHVVSLDANYPVVTAESGFVAWGIRIPEGRSAQGGRRPVVRDINGGLFLTQVPDHAYAALEPRGESASALLGRAQRAIEQERQSRLSLNSHNRYRYKVEECSASSQVCVTVDGVSAHASVPNEGENALWPLASILLRLDIAPSGARSMVEIIAESFDGDHHGERLGVSYADEFMGRLLVAPTKLRRDKDQLTLEVNLRRPVGRSKAEFTQALEEALRRLRKKHAGVEAIPNIYVGEPHAVARNSPLVRELLDIYQAVTGQTAAPLSIPGGTYARLFEGAVDFGPAMPGKPYTGHAADEYIEVAALCQTTRMILEVVLRLGVGLPGPK